MDALWRHSFQNSIRKLTVSDSDSRYTRSSLAFEMNATDFINVVLRKFCYSFMSRVVNTLLNLPTSIVTAIVNNNNNNNIP